MRRRHELLPQIRFFTTDPPNFTVYGESGAEKDALEELGTNFGLIYKYSDDDFGSLTIQPDIPEKKDKFETLTAILQIPSAE